MLMPTCGEVVVALNYEHGDRARGFLDLQGQIDGLCTPHLKLAAEGASPPQDHRL